jgi:hypothetical protein
MQALSLSPMKDSFFYDSFPSWIVHSKMGID